MAKHQKTDKNRRMRALASMRAAIYEMFNNTGFAVVDSSLSSNRLSAVRYDKTPPFRIDIKFFDEITPLSVSSTLNSRNYTAETVDEIWIVGNSMSRHVHESRDDYPKNVRILKIPELSYFVKYQMHNFIPEDTSQISAPKTAPKVTRSSIGKAVMANADQLRTAVVTSMLLIEDKLSIIKQNPANSSESIAKQKEEVGELHDIKGQLEEIVQLPDKLKKGEIKETEAAKKVTTFSEVIKKLWEKKHEVICTRAIDLALFSSYVLVGSLAGASGGWTIAVSAAMVGGKPVMDSLKGLGKQLFH